MAIINFGAVILGINQTCSPRSVKIALREQQLSMWECVLLVLGLGLQQDVFKELSLSGRSVKQERGHFFCVHNIYSVCLMLQQSY